MPKNIEGTIKDFLDLHYRHAKEIKYMYNQFCITGENGVLFQLQNNGGKLSSGELAESLDLTSGRIANILKSLEKKSLILRERDSSDRRHVMASLTDLGMEKINRICEDNKRIMMTIMESIDLISIEKMMDVYEEVLRLMAEEYVEEMNETR